MTSIDCKENGTETKKHTILPFSSVTKMRTWLKKKVNKIQHHEYTGWHPTEEKRIVPSSYSNTFIY